MKTKHLIKMEKRRFSGNHLKKKDLGRLLILIISVCPLLAFSQVVKPDTTRFLIGNKINANIELEILPGSKLEWPVLTDTLSKSIEIISKSKPDTITREGIDKLLVRQLISITSFDTGFLVIPPLTFKVTQPGSQSPQILTSQPVLLEVLNVQVDLKGDIKDIKPLIKAPYTFRDFLPWLLMLLAAGLTGFLIWFYLRKRKQNKPFIKLPAKPQKPPHIIAIEELELLKQEQVWQKGQVKEYYTRLTDILRAYFEARFGVLAAEMTSDEIMNAMKDLLNDAAMTGDLKKLLSLSDMAKFAKAQPIAADNELSLTYARSVIMNTAPAPVTAKEKNNLAGSNTETGTQIKE